MTRARTDANHGEIMRALRLVGVSVVDTSAVKGGFVDLVCGYGGITYLLEVKDGSKPASARKLTEAQRKWRAGWDGGTPHEVASVAEALRACGVTR